MHTHPSCLEWREKLALRREDLSPTDQQALDAHVDTCKACASALADYHFFEARLDALPPPSIKPLPRLSPHFFEDVKKRKGVFGWPLLAAAAVLLLLLASGELFGQLYFASQTGRLSGGDTLCILAQHTDAVTAVAWSPNGKYIATASRDYSVKIWDALDCKLLTTYLGHDDFVYALAWSPDSQKIASASLDETVQIWNALAANSVPLLTYTNHHSPVEAVAWSPNGKYIASGGSDDTIQVWYATTGQELWSYKDIDPDQTEPVDALAWSPNSSEVATGSWNSFVQVFNVRTGQPIYTFAGHANTVTAVAWSPNGKYIASASKDGTVLVWGATSSTMGRVIQTYTKHIGEVNTVAWSPDGQYLASGGFDETVQVWNALTGVTIKTYSEHRQQINGVAWDPVSVGKGSYEIVSGSDDHTARVWQVSGI